MESEKFDQISRSFAGRSNRRDALRTAGKGGLLASLAGALSLGGRDALAAPPTSPAKCTLPLLSKVAVGKNKGKRYDGDLAITIQTGGAIDDGQLTLKDGTVLNVVGQATGRAVNLRIKVADSEFLSLVGTSANEFDLCNGRADGTFGGWAESDLGTWTLGVAPAATTTPTSQATIASGNGGNSGGGNTTSGGNSSSGNGGGNGGGSVPTDTPTPCPEQTCTGIGQLWLPDQCMCGCPDNGVNCNDMSCCPAGSVCADTTSGDCACPSGTEQCNASCVPSCASGSNLDMTSCTCVTATSCGSGETLCNGACVSITCPTGQLFDATSCMCQNQCSSGMALCSGTCIPVTSDANNCGSCGNVCPTGMPCIAGTCECPATYHYDATAMKCFVDCVSGQHNDATGTCVPDA